MPRLALVVVALVAAGCARGGGDANEPAGDPVRPSAGKPSAGPGRALLRFVRASRRGDAAATWSLLSRETRATMGPTLALYRRHRARDLAEDFEDVRAERVLLSRRLGSRLAVAAIAGTEVEEGEDPEDYAYAAALVREAGRWRLELGGLVVGRLEPEPRAETDESPDLAARADAAAFVERVAVWLDGVPLAAFRKTELPFTATVTARPPRPLDAGVHWAVVFAATAETAGAAAWPFEVED